MRSIRLLFKFEINLTFFSFFGGVRLGAASRLASREKASTVLQGGLSFN